ncbi:Probable RNA-directed DNA polymerase from transposon X-element [Eumeta japonica]|uniref:Probable RNA-directed DNA polymerase from transposon X-element n=1 Tax=Eumeta variegata TaxID=151549 RepID=A0A4C1YQ93_EUMVA|nr:Probable RNA-directed DNA polymerase from transposon X-element [Eumeta japonica]
MYIRPVMTYACPVFAHAAPTALQDLQVIQNKFCRRATGAQWYVKNSILHRDLELPTLSNCGLVEAPQNHFLRRPQNALSDPPDDLTAEG